MDYSPPSSSVHGILQARMRTELPFPPPGDLPDPGIKPGSPALQANSLPSQGSCGFPGDSDGKEYACNAEDMGLIPGLRRFPGEENGNSIQYSCLKNSMVRGLEDSSPWSHKE